MQSRHGFFLRKCHYDTLQILLGRGVPHASSGRELPEYIYIWHREAVWLNGEFPQLPSILVVTNRSLVVRLYLTCMYRLA